MQCSSDCVHLHRRCGMALLRQNAPKPGTMYPFQLSPSSTSHVISIGSSPTYSRSLQGELHNLQYRYSFVVLCFVSALLVVGAREGAKHPHHIPKSGRSVIFLHFLFCNEKPFCAKQGTLLKKSDIYD